jgi:hypothetical protein
MLRCQNILVPEEYPSADKIDGWLQVCNFRVGAHGEEA